MGKIRNIYLEGNPIAEEYDTLIPDKIEVLNCVSYPDCSYIETIKFSFYVGSANGSMPGFGPKQIIELDIEAGYIPPERVKEELIRLLSRFKIFKFDELIKAFSYRRYYCRY